MTNDVFRIVGLKWQKRWRANNGGKDTWVVPFPTTRPANIVFHGHKHFDYGQYGIHLGQEDSLTFLGNSFQKIAAEFIDCRENSITFGIKERIEFYPSSERTLHIPPGVAHTFTGLEKVFTINNYEIFLPSPEDLYHNTHNWNLARDILNIPINIEIKEIPKIKPNTFTSSDDFYDILREQQLLHISKLAFQHPITYHFNDKGIKKIVTIKEKKQIKSQDSTWENIPQIFGMGWQSHLKISTGDDSGIVPLLDQSPFYIVDHGEITYSHDSYGIHLGQEDRLTFLGDPNQIIELHLIDCREGSKTLHNKAIIYFNPSPLKFLVIPPGVAHAFKNLENVFTVNRPRIMIDAKGEYIPRNDVIDLPFNTSKYPVLSPNKIAADEKYYKIQAINQSNFIQTTDDYYETPSSKIYEDPVTGKKYKFTLRKKREESFERIEIYT